jgi:hypothetical protein
MRNLRTSLAFGALMLCTLSCGPLERPMPTRLKDDDQLKIDEAWNRALSPITNHNHQALLDLLVTTSAYEIGVDELFLRSTKRFQAGLVVMELHYNRLIPENDRFVVQVFDPEGKLLRQENYDRAEVEKTNKELSMDLRELEQKKESGTATPEELNQLADLKARSKTIEQAFPRFKDKEEDSAGNK